MLAEIPKYSPRPPHTPAIFLCVAERVNFFFFMESPQSLAGLDALEREIAHVFEIVHVEDFEFIVCFANQPFNFEVAHNGRYRYAVDADVFGNIVVRKFSVENVVVVV